MQKARLKRLLHQYFNNTINSVDCIELLDYLNSSDPGELNKLVDEELILINEGPDFKGQQSQEVLNRIKSDLRFGKVPGHQKDIQPKIIKFYQKRWAQFAAAVLIFCTAGIVIFNRQHVKPPATIAKITKPAAIVPGGNKATLTIAGGKTIVLDGAANGLIAKTSAGKVLKPRNGQLIYKTVLTGKQNIITKEVSYNTLSTPRGGEYQVVLPDGTKVWLDAASSITYPVAFTGKDRQVKLTGQAYFEVAKNKEKPFYVHINDVQVRVLGTHFNISAYGNDDNITTTLLEGLVQVSKNDKLALLMPGQQAVVFGSGADIQVSNADVGQAVAWKNGYFVFNDENITDIMKKVSRWYDVDVAYEGGLKDQRFGGIYERSKGINDLLIYLEKIGNVHFSINERRIIVMK